MLWHDVLRCVTLCCAVLCCATLCCAASCSANAWEVRFACRDSAQRAWEMHAPCSASALLSLRSSQQPTQPAPHVDPSGPSLQAFYPLNYLISTGVSRPAPGPPEGEPAPTLRLLSRGAAPADAASAAKVGCAALCCINSKSMPAMSCCFSLCAPPPVQAEWLRLPTTRSITTTAAFLAQPGLWRRGASGV